MLSKRGLLTILKMICKSLTLYLRVINHKVFKNPITRKVKTFITRTNSRRKNTGKTNPSNTSHLVL